MSGNNPTKDTIFQKLAGLSEESSKKQFIFRVHQRLRSQNEEAYEPEMLSIGPYHRGKDKLQQMERYKLQYMKGIQERLYPGRPEEFIQEFREFFTTDEEEARNCYAEEICLSREDFVDMMILDACFIAEFLRKYNVFVRKVKVCPSIYGKVKDDPIFSMKWLVESLCRDLLLFENQLPFFILKHMFELTSSRVEDLGGLIPSALSCLNHCIGVDNPSESSYKFKPSDNGVFHLLGLMYERWCSSRDTHVEEGEHQNSSSAPTLKPQLSPEISVLEPYLPDWVYGIAPVSTHAEESQVSIAMPSNVLSPTTTVEDKDSIVAYLLLKSVRELEEYGIEFEKAEGSKSWFDIMFEDSTMKIPTLVVQDNTESLLRNLIAYEEYMYDKGYSWKVVSHYANFMACLLKSSEDAKMLRHCKIIKNLLGKDEVVSEMFNKICNNIFLYPAAYSYLVTFKKVNEHCSKRRNRWMAELKKTYFNSPWSIIAFLAATFLLLLTLIQTILAILQQVQDTKLVCNCK